MLALQSGHTSSNWAVRTKGSLENGSPFGSSRAAMRALSSLMVAFFVVFALQGFALIPAFFFTGSVITGAAG